MHIPGLAAYAATKTALNMLSETARVELAPANIRVITVYPRMTATDFGKNSLGDRATRQSQREGAPANIVVDSPEYVVEKILAAARHEPAEQYMDGAMDAPVQAIPLEPGQMKLTLITGNDMTFVEGIPGEVSLANAGDVDRLIEACFSEGASAALLYAANLPLAFFDISSGEAGIVLQKLRTYHIRLAVVCPPGSVTFSSRFREMVDDEMPKGHFGLFETRQAAVDWLQQLAT